MNILEVVIGPYPGIRGGVDKMVSLLIDGLVHGGCQVTVFVPGPWDAAEVVEAQVGSVSVYTLRLRTPFERARPMRSVFGWLGELPCTLRALRRICVRHRIAVAHIHMATNYVYWFRLLHLLGGPPYVVTFHRGDVVDFAKRRRLDCALIRWALAGAAATNAVSRWIAAEAKRVFQGLCDPVCIYNGIAGDRSGEIVPVIPDHIRSLVAGDPYFIMVGVFDPYKGHDIAIRAWGLLPRESRPHLLIVGEGELREFYDRLISEEKCGDRVHLTGQLPNAEVQQLMVAATAMVFPSRSEGLPYVALEAGLAGLPLICTRVPPFDEIVADGESGILVRPEDPKALADAIRRVAADADLRCRLGANLRRAIETKFSTEAMVDGYLKLFSTLSKDGRS